MRFWLITCLSIAASALCGCQSSAATGGSVATPALPTAEEACATSVKARCDRLSACSNGYLLKTRYGDMETCQVRETLACLTSLAAKGTGSSPKTVMMCAAALPAQSCWDLFVNTPPADCVPPNGALPNGQACFANGHCQSTWCAIGRHALTGTCAAPPKAGDPCDTFPCGRGQLCEKDASGKQVCMTPLGATGSCDQDHHCGPGVACVGLGKTALTGTCQTQVSAPGAACDAANGTAAECDPRLGLFCDGTGHCQAISLAGAGQACGTISADTQASCSASGVCVVAAASDVGGICKAAAADNSPCDADATKGPGCITPARCVHGAAGGTAGTCVLPTGQ